MKHIIWTYWHQGFHAAPYIVQQCILQLQYLHPEATIRLLDKNNVHDYADPVPVKTVVWSKMALPHRSDLLRTQLLLKYGGIWLDPTVYCVQPLENWLPQQMKNGLFLFHRPGKDRIIANWFIAAEKGNYLLQMLYDALIKYWNEHDFRNLGSQPQNRMEYWCKRIINGRSLILSQLWLSPIFTKILRLYPYMIYHYIFYHLIRNDDECRRIYEIMPKFSAEWPIFLKEKGFDYEMNYDKIQWLKEKNSPLFKLDWKVDLDEFPENSLILTLLNKKLQT